MKKVMIMAGGTGGHVFPGIALADALSQQNVEVIWLGTEGGMEKAWVEKADIPFFNIAIKGLRGNGLLGWLKAPINVTRAWWQARRIMQQQAPDLVLGMGGFVCGPGGLAAKSLGIPLVIHEQNAIPGLTNKLLSPIARRVMTAFPQDTLRGKHVVQMGNPVREGLETIPTLAFDANPRPLKILVLGGSRGALALNEKVPQALALMPDELRPQVTHQTGAKTLAQAKAFYQETGVEASVVPFIDNMVAAYSQADLVICRSGALTVSELMASARPAIMVPYPHAVDDHQTANAQALTALGGGEVIQQSELSPERLAARMSVWLNRQTLQQTSERIRQQSSRQATQRITRLLLDLLTETA